MLPQVRVKDIMRKKVVTLDESKHLIDVAKFMVGHKVAGKGIGSVVITRKGRAVGIVTERDFIEKIAVRGLDVRKIRVREVMSSPIVSCTPETTISEAAGIMGKNGIRHLLVMEGDKVFGMIAAYDLVIYGWTGAIG
jgi:CBS domain-containing protein